MSVDRTSLEAKVREGSGKGVARKLRAGGLIPAIVYGRHLETPTRVCVDPLKVREAIATPHKLNTLISLKIEGQQPREVLLKDFQQDPVSRELLHADFVEVRQTEKVRVKIPLILTGKSEGVAVGGILAQSRRELEVWALPGAIPEKIEADVTHLKIAQALHISDVKLPAGIEVKTHVNYTVAVVSAPEKEEVVAAPVAAPGAAPVAGAPAAGTEGKAPAAADGKAPAASDAKAAPAAAPAKKEDKKK